MRSFINAPGMRLRVHAPRDIGREMRLRLRRLTDKAFWLAAISASSLAFTQPGTRPRSAAGWLTFIFASGMGRCQLRDASDEPSRVPRLMLESSYAASTSLSAQHPGIMPAPEPGISCQVGNTSSRCCGNGMRVGRDPDVADQGHGRPNSNQIKLKNTVV